MYLIELIQSYYPEYRQHGTKDGEVVILCPFCQQNGHAGPARHTLGINTDKEVGHCHRCNFKGAGRRLFDALADEAHSNDEYETDNRVDQPGLHKREDKGNGKLPRIDLPKEYEPLFRRDGDSRPLDLDHVGREAMRYLIDRGITDKQILKHQIGFAAVGKYAYRIILPVFSGKARDAITSFTTRTFRNAEPKYLNSDGDKFIFNYPRNQQKIRQRGLLVEGPFDVLNLERHLSNRYDVLGRFGSSMTYTQLKYLSKYQELVIWPDPDIPGVEGSIKVAHQLLEETDIRIFGVVPDIELGKDPGSLNIKEITAQLGTVKPWTRELERRLKVKVLF